LCISSAHYSNADHPNLHSFPTRRSSDLHENEHRVRTMPARQFEKVERSGGIDREIGMWIARCPIVRRLRRRMNDERDVASIAFEDRKSTLLNSSHSQISYAVFCLKKKKK